MTVDTKNIGVLNVPVETVEFLRPHAVRAGFPDSDSGAMRYAAAKQEERLRAAGKNGDSHPAIP